MATGSKSEKDRDGRRIERWYLACYLRVFDDRTGEIRGQLVDIAPQGMLLIGDSPVPVERTWRVRMRLPVTARDQHLITFTAISRWCRQDSQPGFYLTGYQIGDLSPKLEKLLNALIHDFGYEKKGEKG